MPNSNKIIPEGANLNLKLRLLNMGKYQEQEDESILLAQLWMEDANKVFQ